MVRAMKWQPLLLVSSVASAGPIASAALDVDGDGASDKLELGADGTLAIVGSKSGLTTVAIGKPTPRAELRAANVHGTPTVIVLIAPRRDEMTGEAIVL